VGIIIACIATLILLSYSSATFYWNKIIDLEFRLWDVNTCTVADFTVDMKISKALHESFENYKKETGSIHKPFDEYLKEQIEEIL
jgi:hypothetical protein